jgi:hypothetical protein
VTKKPVVFAPQYNFGAGTIAASLAALSMALVAYLLN